MMPFIPSGVRDFFCTAAENLRARKIEALLPKPAEANSNSFLNGQFAIEHESEKVSAFFRAIADEIFRYRQRNPVAAAAYDDFRNNPRCGERYPGVLPRHLDHLMYRASCIDSGAREWGQPALARQKDPVFDLSHHSFRTATGTSAED